MANNRISARDARSLADRGLLELPARAGVGRRAKRPPAPLAAPTCAVEVMVPLVVVSEANRRDHWTARRKRNRDAFGAWWLAVGRGVGSHNMTVHPLALTFTRLGGRRLDDDNLAGAFKALRDVVCRWLLRDDGDPQLTFAYRQRPGPGPQGVIVRIETGRQN